jgi:hypothetical protein
MAQPDQDPDMMKIVFLLFNRWIDQHPSGGLEVSISYGRTPVPPFPAFMNQLVRTAVSAELFAARPIVPKDFYKLSISNYLLDRFGFN